MLRSRWLGGTLRIFLYWERSLYTETRQAGILGQMELCSCHRTSTEHGIWSKVLNSATCLDSGRRSSVQMVGENAERELGFVVVVVATVVWDKYFNTIYFSLYSFHSWGQWDLGLHKISPWKIRQAVTPCVPIPCCLLPIAHECFRFLSGSCAVEPICSYGP